MLANIYIYIYIYIHLFQNLNLAKFVKFMGFNTNKLYSSNDIVGSGPLICEMKFITLDGASNPNLSTMTRVLRDLSTMMSYLPLICQ